MNGPWMQIHSGVDPATAETKSHCCAHHGCGYVRIPVRGLVVGCTSHPGVRSVFLIDMGLIFFFKKEKVCTEINYGYLEKPNFLAE